MVLNTLIRIMTSAKGICCSSCSQECCSPVGGTDLGALGIPVHLGLEQTLKFLNLRHCELWKVRLA